MRLTLLIIAATTAVPAGAAWRPGRNNMVLRGQEQAAYFLPAEGTSHGRVLYFPGDAGWRGLAIDIGKAIAHRGYDVIGVDTNRYLSSFTGDRTLTEAEMMADMLEFGRRAGEGQTVLFAGWSQGAAMGALAGAAPDAARVFHGIVAIGLPAGAVLGWRVVDNLTWITKKAPGEPVFQVGPHLRKNSVVPLVIVQSRGDEYTTTGELEGLYAAAAAPKKLLWVESSDHKFSNARDAFYRSLEQALVWLEQLRSKG